MAAKKQGSATIVGSDVTQDGASASTDQNAGATAPSNEGQSGGAPANVPAAETFEASGAPVQDTGQIDPSHPAVDDNPREGTTEDQNRIDFNDPTISGSEAVARNLKAAD